MAIESSNRSPSPMSTRPNPNPNFANSRNYSEKRGDGGVRKSFSGSPFSKPSIVAHRSPWCINSKTPANSPAEYPRRNSFSNDSTIPSLSRDSNEHKENNKPNANSKQLRGSKNFMSPTISAASKVNASPRKKVLAERNEAVRTSASLSDGKFLFFAAAEDGDLKGETENCQFEKELDNKEETHLSTCEAKKRVTFDDDVVVLSPEVISLVDANEPSKSFSVSDVIKPNDFAENERKDTCLDIKKATTFVSSPSAVSPLDADPSIPPYDPKTNYLSPRPQFLRYKPHPEIALYLNDHQRMNLEDTFNSETCSDYDSESIVEEVQSKEVPVQEEFLDSSIASSSVVEAVKLESSDDSAQAHWNEETSAESETLSKPRSTTRWRTITWILLLGLVALLSTVIVTHSPEYVVVSSSHQALPKMYEYKPINEFVKADFVGLLHDIRIWSVNHLPSKIFSFREADNRFNPSQFLNCSALQCAANDHWIESGALGFPGGEIEFVKEKRNGLLETKMDTKRDEETALLPSSKVPEQNVEYLGQTGQIKLEHSGEDEFTDALLPSSKVPEQHVEYLGQTGMSSHPDIESQPNLEANHEEVEAQSNQQPEQDELLKLDNVDLEPFEAMFVMPLDIKSEHDSKAEGQPESEDVAPQQNFSEEIQKENEGGLDDLEELNSYNTVETSKTEGLMTEGSAEDHHQILGAQSGIVFLVASLCLAIAFRSLAVFAKSKKAAKSTSTRQAEISMKKEASLYRNPSSHGSPFEVVDLDGETCPSQMSSFSSYEKGVRGTDNEAQSMEQRKQPRRNYKRESLASSSSEYTMGSSYGSFTTYSIIPTKHGDEEVTPVRRSSRIRKC